MDGVETVIGPAGDRPVPGHIRQRTELPLRDGGLDDRPDVLAGLEAIVEEYADRYPSKIPGGALEGPLPAGPDNEGPRPEDKEDYDPANPKADLDKYDSKKTKLPPKK